MAYIETSPASTVAPFVQAFWQSRGAAAPGAAQRVLPDVCTDIIVDLSDPSCASAAAANLIGTMTRAIVVPGGASDLFGIRFRPGVTSVLWPLPMAELCDGRAAFRDVVDAPVRALAEQLAASDEFQTRVAIAEHWLADEIARHAPDSERVALVRELNVRLTRGDGPDALADALDWHPRRLQRFFKETYGASAVTLACFWRYERARLGLSRAAHGSLAEFALDAGYADQAHLAREFQRFSGLTISAWRATA